MRTAADVSRLEATLSGRDVSTRFRRADAGRWEARVPANPGKNDLTVRGFAGDAEKGTDFVRFLGGSREPSLLDLRSERRAAGRVPVALRISGEADVVALRARLNGRRVEDSFGPRFGRLRTARLSRSDGLRFGMNRLRVVARTEDGTFDTATHRVRVPRTKPLAAAGTDAIHRGGRSIRLDGSASLPGARRSKLKYVWRIVGAPDDSKASLTRSRSLRPKLKPDAVGAYRVRLTVIERRGGPRWARGSGRASAARRSTDTIVLTNQLNIPPLGLPVQTIRVDVAAQQVGIQIGGQFFDQHENSQDHQLTVVMLDRVSGSAFYYETFAGTAADAETLQSDIGTYAAQKPLVFISNGQAATLDPAFDAVFKSLGADLVQNVESNQQDFSIIAIPGTEEAVWQNPTWNDENAATPPGSLNGYLRYDLEGNLAFSPDSRLAFDSSAPGAPSGQNVIELDGQSYGSGPLEDPSSPGTTCGTGGFQVVSFSAEFLKLLNSETFTTNGCGANSDEQGQSQMASFLNGLASQYEGAQIVVIQSLGNPRGSNDGNWGALADAVAGVGGTQPVFADAQGSYALLTATDALANDQVPAFGTVESSQHETGKPARITAILAQGRDGFFDRREASPLASGFDFDLTQITHEPDGEPFFGWGSTDEQNALAYFAQQILDLPAPEPGISCYIPPQPDVRSEYCNLSLRNNWSGWQAKIASATYPQQPKPAFSQAAFETVQSALAGDGYNEFQAVTEVWATLTEVQLSYLNVKSTSVPLAQQAAAEITDSIETYKTSAEGWWSDVIGNVLSTFSYALPEDAVPVVGLFSGVLYGGEDVSNGEDGAPALDQFEVAAAQFAGDLSASLAQSFESVGLLGNLIVSDGVKLRAFYEDPTLSVGSQQLTEFDSAAVLGFAQFSIQSLLPAAYELVELDLEGINTGITDARDYECSIGEQSYWPFEDADPSAQWWVPSLGRLFVLVEVGADLPSNQSEIEHHPPTPSADLMKPLFEPYAVDSDGDPTQFNFFPNSFYPSTYDVAGATVVDC